MSWMISAFNEVNNWSHYVTTHIYVHLYNVWRMIIHFLKDKMNSLLAFLWGILLFTSLILQSPTTHRYQQQLGYGLITILDSDADDGVNFGFIRLWKFFLYISFNFLVIIFQRRNFEKSSKKWPNKWKNMGITSNLLPICICWLGYVSGTENTEIG